MGLGGQVCCRWSDGQSSSVMCVARPSTHKGVEVGTHALYSGKQSCIIGVENSRGQGCRVMVVDQQLDTASWRKL